VFKNFMKGDFCKNKEGKGIYFEDGIYDDSNSLKIDKNQSSSEMYIGSHAVAIIGWGIEKNVKISGKKIDIPFWFCRNSWTDKWGDSGYFKMAMYPYNKISQFDKQVVINSKSGRIMGGGMIIFSISNKPKLVNMNSLKLENLNLSKPDDYYKESKTIPVQTTKKKISNKLVYFIIILTTILMFFFIVRSKKNVLYLQLFSIFYGSLALICHLLGIKYPSSNCDQNIFHQIGRCFSSIAILAIAVSYYILMRQQYNSQRLLSFIHLIAFMLPFTILEIIISSRVSE